MVVLWVSRPHLSMDNSLRCPWGLHLAPRRRRRVTATAAVLERPWPSALSGHGHGSPTMPGAQFGHGSFGCTFLVGWLWQSYGRRRRPRSPRSTLFAAPAASATGSRVSGLDEGARDGRASVLWSPLTLRRRLRPSAEEGEANTMAVGDADDICAKYLDGLSWKTVKKAARALSPVIEKIQNSVKLKHFSLADIEPLCPGKVVRDSFLPHNSSSTRRRRRQIVVGDGAGAAPTNPDPNSRQTRAKTGPVGPRWRPENPLLGSAPAGQSKYRHVP